MKKVVFLMAFCWFGTLATAQDKKNWKAAKPVKNATVLAQAADVPDTVPPYLKEKSVPKFRILTDLKPNKDSVFYANTQLPADRPIVIVFFSPECSHCHHEMQEILKHYDSLKRAFFVFASFHNLDSIRGFAKKYNSEAIGDFVFGRDLTYFFPPYYKMRMFPFIALYGNDKKLIKVYEQGADVADLIAKIAAIPEIDSKKKKAKQP